MGDHLMISYSRADKACAYKLQRQLEAQGYKIWIDKDDIGPGAPFPIKILEAIREARAVLVLWSAASSTSHFVVKEIEEALSQRMIRNMPIVPIWLDNTPLHRDLQATNAIHMTACTDSSIDELVSLLKTLPLRYRHFLPQPTTFDPSRPLGVQGAQILPTTPEYVALDVMRSVHCSARVIATPGTVLKSLKVVQVFLQFPNTDESLIGKVIETQRESPLFLFHVSGGQLNDSPTDAPHGDWLDIANATQELLTQFIGRGGATLQLFNLLPTSLNFAIGTRFYNFWHVELFHYRYQQRHYQLVLDTNDL